MPALVAFLPTTLLKPMNLFKITDSKMTSSEKLRTCRGLLGAVLMVAASQISRIEGYLPAFLPPSSPCLSSLCVCVWIWVRAYYDPHMKIWWLFQSGSSSSTKGSWNQTHVIRFAQKVFLPIKPSYFLWELASLFPFISADQQAVGGVWQSSIVTQPMLVGLGWFRIITWVVKPEASIGASFWLLPAVLPQWTCFTDTFLALKPTLSPWASLKALW